MRATIKILIGVLLVAICLVIAKGTYAHGSATGHANGNGHADHSTGTEPGNAAANAHSAAQAHAASQAESVSRSHSDATANNAVAIGDLAGGSAYAEGSSATVDVFQGGSSADFSGSVAVENSYYSEAVAATAATIIPAYCQSGASGQSRHGGFAIVNSEQLCDYWAAAKVALEAYQLESRKASCAVRQCEVASQPQCNIVEAEMRFCPSDAVREYHTAKALEHYRHYEWNLAAAQELLEATEHTAKADRMAGQAVRPGVILWLILKAVGG